MPPLSVETFAPAVDHTLLDAAAGSARIDQLCDEAAEHGFASVCVYPWWVARAAGRLAGRSAVCTVAGFPHGLDSTESKRATALRAVADGASEVDVVLAYGPMADGDERAAGDDLAAVVAAAHDAGALVKVIVEASRLSEEQLVRACSLVAASGAEFGKSNTGTTGGATVEAVALIRRELPARVAVKASGGIRTAEQAAAMLEAGATRLGTSSAVAILEELSVYAVA
jgi:deoxyribose-phosphate aldolase